MSNEKNWYFYLKVWKMSASSPLVVKRSLQNSPCAVRSLRDRLPMLPCKARSPSRNVKIRTHSYVSIFILHLKYVWHKTDKHMPQTFHYLIKLNVKGKSSYSNPPTKNILNIVSNSLSAEVQRGLKQYSNIILYPLEGERN